MNGTFCLPLIEGVFMSHTVSFPAKTDVIVVGGGLVGGVMSCALAVHGLSVVCLDAQPACTLLDDTYDGRASAIALSCRRILEVVGIWEHLQDVVQPILDIRVTDADSPLFLHYDHTDIGTPMGYMAENKRIRWAINQRMQELDAITFLAPCRVRSLHQDSGVVGVTLEDGRRLDASLLVAADGRKSAVREMAGIPVTRGFPYNQTGIVLTIQHEKHHAGIAHERFLPSGPFAILPLPGGYHSSLVWTERNDLAQIILGLSQDGFHVELMQRLGSFLGDVIPVSPVFSYALGLQHAARYIDNRIALVGDAAHGMHPVAGQGMNFGLRDVAALVEEVVGAKRLGLGVGAPQALENYQKWRRFDNTLMLGMTDGLVRLFSNDSLPLRTVRTMGLAVVNHLPRVRRFFMQHAMGEVGTLPRLLRGLPV